MENEHVMSSILCITSLHLIIILNLPKASQEMFYPNPVSASQTQINIYFVGGPRMEICLHKVLVGKVGTFCAISCHLGREGYREPPSVSSQVPQPTSQSPKV